MGNSNTHKRNFKHISHEQKRFIERWQRENITQTEIARRLGVDRSSISRQIKIKTPCGMSGKLKYKADFAHEQYLANRKKSVRKNKILLNPEFKKYLEDCIKKKWSPKVAVGLLDKKTICVKSVYNNIWNGNIKVSWSNMWMKGRRRKKRSRITRKNKRILGKSIELRPNITNREEFGHWELDTVKYGHTISVLSLLERKTRYAIFIKLKDQIAKTVNEEIELLANKYPFKTITTDNGSEFSSLFEVVEELYFTHPYSSWEKGSVENANGMFRRYLPRGTVNVTEEKVAKACEQVNSYPREILGFKTAKECFTDCMNKCKVDQPNHLLLCCI